MKQTHKLKWIGRLMLVSELLLLLFLGRWMTNQYKEAEVRFDKDIGMIFTKVENNISDSLLNSQVASLLKNQQVSDTLITLNLSTADTGFVNLPGTNHKILNIIKDSLPSTQVHKQGNISVQSYAVAETPVAIDRPEIRKVLRLTLQQVLHDIDHNVLRQKTDTTLLRNEFTKTVQQKWPGITVIWQNDSLKQKSFAYKAKDVQNILSLKGYQLYVVKSVFTQAIFCIILLLLISLAFILAYRNAKQQTLFSLQKDHFISNISHELKTPVATTKVAIEALSNYDALEDPQRSKRYLRMAGWEINRLETMINKIMDITMVSNGILTLDKTPLNLPELVREITHSLQQILIEQNIQLQWHIPNTEIFVLADRIHLTGAIYNLIDNAIKYGNNLIRISIYQKEHKVYLMIADNGNGIPEAYRTRIFEKFVRIPQGDNIHNVKGYGIGLSYAQYIIAAHHGLLKLKSERDWGAVFSIYLPEFQENEI